MEKHVKYLSWVKLFPVCLIPLFLSYTTVTAQTTDEFLTKLNASKLGPREAVYKKVDTLNLKLRLYYPPDDNKNKIYPAIIFFFGGGWTGGSYEQFEKHAKYFAMRGMVAVLADYRVYSRNKTSPFEAVKDARSAIRYLRINSRELRIDSGKIVASGGSAGGHLAAATDLTRLDEPNENISVSARPSALVLFNPVFDNGPDGYGYDRVGERYTEISPLHNIIKGAAPTIVFLGTKDKFIPVKTAELYKRKLEEVGSRCALFLYKDQPHGFFNFKARKDNHYFFETLKQADTFLVSLGYIKPVAPL